MKFERKSHCLYESFGFNNVGTCFPNNILEVCPGVSFISVCGNIFEDRKLRWVSWVFRSQTTLCGSGEVVKQNSVENTCLDFRKFLIQNKTTFLLQKVSKSSKDEIPGQHSP